MLDAIEATSRAESIDNWPSYDIAKTGEDNYRITMAIAGFSQNELAVTQERNMLVVSGQKADRDDVQYLHRGIAGRVFQRRFELADHVRVADANLENGLLTIELKRELPEEMKPRRIEIAAGAGPQLETTPQIETRRREAEKQAA
jgi:molecular chaperone IbpA